jgi:hypothetical protein
MAAQLTAKCSGGMCSFGEYNGDLDCDTGDGSCWTARMAEADNTTKFHDKELYEATAKIHDILKNIKTPTDGRQLSFVHTDDGTILAWVRHNGAHKDAVKYKHGHEKVKKALKIKGPKK